MKKLIKEFEYRGEKYEIMLVKRTDGVYFLKDFNREIPFSPFYYCVSDLGFIDINETEAGTNRPMLNYLISQSVDGARYWADNKHMILACMSN